MSARLHPAMTFNGLRTVQQDYGLTPVQFAAYMAIALATDGKDGKTKPISYAEIARRANISRSYAYSCAKKLQSSGLIDWTGSNAGNVYELTWGVSHRNTLHGEIDTEITGGVVHGDTPAETSAKNDEGVSHRNTSVSTGTTPVSPVDTLAGRARKGVYKAKEQDKEQTLPPLPPAVTSEPPRPTIYAEYEQRFGPLTEWLGKRLTDLRERFEHAAIIDAFDQAVANRADKPLNYATAILERRKALAASSMPQEAEPPAKEPAMVFEDTTTTTTPGEGARPTGDKTFAEEMRERIFKATLQGLPEDARRKLELIEARRRAEALRKAATA